MPHRSSELKYCYFEHIKLFDHIITWTDVHYSDIVERKTTDCSPDIACWILEMNFQTAASRIIKLNMVCFVSII